MASFKKLPSGKWCAEIRRKGFPGMSKSFSSRARAEEWARRMELQIETGEFQEKLALASMPTLSDVLDDYCKQVTPKKKGADVELIRIKAMSRKPIAQQRLPEITRTTIADYRDERLEEVQANTVRLELALISVVFNWCINERGMNLAENPVAKVKKPVAPPGRDRRLKGDEEERLLVAACGNGREQGGGRKRSNEFYVIVLMGIDTAMRFGETLRLLWSQVDLDHGVVYLKTGETKNMEKREVPLSPRVVDALKALDHKDDDDNVFHYSVGGFKSVWYDTLTDAGIAIGDLHYHDLRHESTSRLFENGGLNVVEVASVTGHKDLKMLKRYTHLKGGDIRKKIYGDGTMPVAPVEERLTQLKKLHADKLITKKDFEVRKKEILAAL